MSEARQAKLATIEAIVEGLGGVDYIASRRIATTIFVAASLKKPILVEGPAGVGKTELALSTAAWLDLPLIRMQCYEGLDEAKALYEWKYGKQLLYTQLLKEKLGKIVDGTNSLAEAVERLHQQGDIFYSEQFLEPRPLLKALRQDDGAVLLIDEIDKSDEEFEAYLLEILSDYQVSIPEIGTIKATVPPMVFLTSNNTREMGDALKRRCLHLFIPFPDGKQLGNVQLRIGAPRESVVDDANPEDLKRLHRGLGAYLSARDQTQLVIKSIEAEDITDRFGIPFQVFYGISANSHRFWGISDATKKIGYAPEDNSAVKFADQVGVIMQAAKRKIDGEGG